MDFRAFMEQLALPSKAKNPAQKRLDGRKGGGNRECFGEFYRNGKVWKVHADTRFEPLEVAYRTEIAGRDPFVETQTNGSNICLELRPGLWPQRYKHLYIYANSSNVLAKNTHA
jgi:hypothetical protein